MTANELLALGATRIHWNPDYNGGFHEYYLPIDRGGLEFYDTRIGICLNERPEHPARVYLIAPRSTILMLGVRNTDDLLQLYRFVAGKEWGATARAEVLLR